MFKQTIDTTIGELRRGVTLTETVVKVCYDPIGHLSVRLLDAAGRQPLASALVEVDIPGEGTLSLVSSAEGHITRRDVPFQDYELRVTLATGEELSVEVPAVASRDERHERHVPDAVRAYVELELRDAADWRLAEERVILHGDGGRLELVTDEEGRISRALPLPPGTYTLEVGGRSLEVQLPALPVPRLVTIG